MCQLVKCWSHKQEDLCLDPPSIHVKDQVWCRVSINFAQDRQVLLDRYSHWITESQLQ